MNKYFSASLSKDLILGTELSRILTEGSVKEKEYALLNMALSGENPEQAILLFLKYTKDNEMELIAHICLNKMLENSTKFSLHQVLPVLRAGLGHPNEVIRIACQNGLDCLVKPVDLKTNNEIPSFVPFFLKPNLVKTHLESASAEKIITALLYLFYKPHKDPELFDLLDTQLAKNIPAVNCIVGAIIDTKLSNIIKDISALSELSIKSYGFAKENDLKSKPSWVYRRFDSIRELAREHMHIMKEIDI